MRQCSVDAPCAVEVARDDLAKHVWECLPHLSQEVASRQLRWCIVSAVSAAFPGSASFCVTCLPLCSNAGLQLVDDLRSELVGEDADAVWRSLLMQIVPGEPCRAQEATPLWRSQLPELFAPEHTELLYLSLGPAEECLGAVGVARRKASKPFAESDRLRLESIGVAAWKMVALQQHCDELKRRAVVMRAIPAFDGCYCVIDEDRQSVVWSFSTDDASCEEYLREKEQQLVAMLERNARASSEDSLSAGHHSVGFGQVVKIVSLGAQPLFGAERCSVVALTVTNGMSGGLSPRELQTARLLIAGYTALNASAILNVSENTVRTYVRRLYRKLNVANRAELARRCAAELGMVGPFRQADEL